MLLTCMAVEALMSDNGDTQDVVTTPDGRTVVFQVGVRELSDGSMAITCPAELEYYAVGLLSDAQDMLLRARGDRMQSKGAGLLLPKPKRLRLS